MSQTSIERLREYLAQLPPQAQALLMREFERALERGQDTAVATLVLDQLRKIVRKTEADEAAPPRTDDLSRLLFQVLEPFLVEAGAPIRVGQIRRSSLAPIWQWLGRDGAPDKLSEFEAALARTPARQCRPGRSAGLEAPGGRRGCHLRADGAGRRRQVACACPRWPAQRDRGPLFDRGGARSPRGYCHPEREAAALSCAPSAMPRSPR